MAATDTLNGLLADPNQANLLGLAMGLLGSSGATRLPTTMGAALGAGLQGSQQFASQSIQNAINSAGLVYKQWLLDKMNNRKSSATPGSDQQQQIQANPVSNTQSLLDAATPQQSPIGAALNSSPYGGAYQGVTLPPLPQATQPPQQPLQQQAQQQQQNQNSGGLFGNMSPDEQALAYSAMFNGDPGRVFSALYQNDPNIVGATTKAKTQNSLFNLRNNGILTDASGNIIRSNPKLGTGQILTNTGVEAAPGYMQTSIPMEVAQQQAANITMPGAVVQGASGTEYPRTRAEQLNQPTTAQGILANYLGSASLIPGQNTPAPTYAPRISVSPQKQKPAQQFDDNGIPIPPPMSMPSKSGPVSLGVPTLAAMTENMKQSTKTMNDAIHAGTDYQAQLGSLAEMQNSLSQLATGPGKSFNVGLQKVADGIATALGMKNPYNFRDITDSQVLNKTTILFSESVVGANNQNAQKALETIQNAVPNIHNTVAANDINAATLTATAAYKKAEADFASRWSQSKYNPGGTGYIAGSGSWDSNFQKQVPYMAFLLNNLSPSARQELLAYSTKNATLAYQIKQAQAAAPFLVRYGYIQPGGQ